MRKRLAILTSLMLCALLLSLAAPVTAQSTKPTIVVAYDGDIDHVELMEFRSVSAYDATANLYEPLLTQKLVANNKVELIGQREFVAAGAASWEVSKDGTGFTFHLRKDAKFADGTPIKASDYKYTFDRAITGPGYLGLLTPFMAIKSADQVKVIDDYTLQITTDRPAALTETILAFQVFGAISQATAQTHATSDDKWAEKWFRTNSNSSGPYTIGKWNPGVEYLFSPNPNYWRGADFFKNSGLVFRVVPDAATREQLLRTGDVDVALGVPFGDLAKLAEDKNITIHAVPTTRIYHLGMNNKVKPFDDVRVRQAVSMAVPYDAIIKNVILGYGDLPKSPVSVGMEGHTDQFWTYGKHDVAAAKALLKDAGFADGFKIDLTVPQEDQTRVDAAVWVQSGLAEIGITVNVNAVPTARYSELLTSHNLPFFIEQWYSWGNDPFYQLTFNLKCDAFTNYVQYCNKEVDQLIDQGTFSRDKAERAKLITRAQEIIVKEAPWAFLYQPQWIVATRSNVTGIALFDDLTLRYAYLGKK